jgi:dephospho-CoA kinase
MNTILKRNEKTRKLLIEHLNTYPKLKTRDIFKYIFQSSFGCEHLVSSESMALDYIKREYETISKTEAPRIDPLDGEYSRVYLSYLNGGLKPETLAKLFCLSAKKESDGKSLLEEKIQVAKELVANGALPLEDESFYKALGEWSTLGYPAVHHSDEFRMEYRPAYRVIANRYVRFLPIFTEIDKIACKGNIIVAIEGGSASGKSTLSHMLEEVYGCTVFHMDDFFLRPEQPTSARFAEIGGNVDRERFDEEVLQALRENKPVRFRRFDCQTQTLEDPQIIEPQKITIIEGVYSTHPFFSRYYDLSIFLDIDPDYQRKRILIRNTPYLAERFFHEWIPLENKYFSGTEIKERCDLVLPICE